MKEGRPHLSNKHDVPEKDRFVITVSGKVQGVGYRFFVREHALKLGITGWVCNQNDGTVKMEIQGQKNVIDDFCAILKNGPLLSHVKEIKALKIPIVEKDSGFDVRFNGL